MKYTKKNQLRYKSISTLKKRAWKIFSEYIRKKEKGVCFTCGYRDNWKNMQAGHCIHGDAVDFIEENIHCQCIRCNKFLNGNLEIYIPKFIRLYGFETYQKILDQKHKKNKYSISELENIILKYKNANLEN